MNAWLLGLVNTPFNVDKMSQHEQKLPGDHWQPAEGGLHQQVSEHPPPYVSSNEASWLYNILAKGSKNFTKAYKLLNKNLIILELLNKKSWTNHFFLSNVFDMIFKNMFQKPSDYILICFVLREL